MLKVAAQKHVDYRIQKFQRQYKISRRQIEFKVVNFYFS